MNNQPYNVHPGQAFAQANAGSNVFCAQACKKTTIEACAVSQKAPCVCTVAG